ncbi:hypothetical protein RBH26_01405 [Natronolimnohabitans sp. A-GB9]|uniref:hypothetical protein n=1 Tax=Natronolimnohabitans sp. A-GB9 TaxID=3069757 RepID=UPI0027B4BD01|nr:hypothetical protein [Natronolimnohabitans sp. A-GB9]MDQ2049131.1 hypothetical protein [Natronolimnohabitans sp. A-GB9]
MRALTIELEDETVDALEAERELFGFESRGAYVRWIIANRGSIEAEREPDHDVKQDRVLTDHGERIARLEKRVAVLEETVEVAGDGRAETRASDEPAESDERTVRGESTGTDSNSSRARSGDDQPLSRERRPRRDGTAEATADREPELEVRGAPRTVRQGPDSRIRPDENERTASVDGTETGDGDRSNEDDAKRTAVDSGPESVDRSPSASGRPAPISPERVARIPEDPVHEDAGVLGSVEAERLDELSRRAVATTRKRLDRDVQTGLEYASSTRLTGGGVRPGEDIADLDELSIPGRSAETLEKRRHAVGRALAYLRDEGRARRSDFVDALYGECPAGYETADSWWECVKTGLKQVEAVEGGEGARVWRFRD